ASMMAWSSIPTSLRRALLPGHLDQRAGRARPAAQLARPRTLALHFLRFLRLAGEPAAESDLAVGGVHTEDLDLDLVAGLDDVLGALDLVVGQLADVQQALQAGLQLDEDPEVGELGDLALLDLTWAVASGDVALPGVVVHLLEAQRDALAFLVHVED